MPATKTTAYCRNALHISIQLKPELSKLNNHILYSSISTIGELREFMRWHVFAVWDFMSLLKALQNKLTGMQLPWQPPKDNASARLINDIVLNEETDINECGQTSSHLELYLDSMLEIGADRSNFDRFNVALSQGNSLDKSLEKADVPQFVRNFVCHTIDTAKGGSLSEISSCFVFGRESVIPGMFQNILNNWQIKSSEAPLLHYYLMRHIQIDKNEHGPAAITLLNNIINRHQDNGYEALRTARESIVMRIMFWDGIKSILDSHKGHTS